MAVKKRKTRTIPGPCRKAFKACVGAKVRSLGNGGYAVPGECLRRLRMCVNEKVKALLAKKKKRA